MTSLTDVVRLETDGYEFLSKRRAFSRDPDLVPVQLLLTPAVAVAGPALTRVFYDPTLTTRDHSVPGFVQDTLFGRGAVHTLDGPDHLERKALLIDLLHQHEPATLLERIDQRWDDAATIWENADSPIVLHVAAAELLFLAGCDWLGIPTVPGEERVKARWMLQMVDGFMPTGPRHVRARLARRHAEAWLREHLERARRARGGYGTRFLTLIDGCESLGLGPPTTAVEALNVLRPLTAVSWFVSYAAHAFHRWPDLRAKVIDPGYAVGFVQELRRFYPFVPFLGARARHEVELSGLRVPQGCLVLLDVYGQHHDPRWWDGADEFRPERFVGQPPDPWTLVPQGGGDVHTGHRCPGEDLTVGILSILVRRLAELSYDVPPQDSSISLRRIPARTRSGFILDKVRVRAGTESV